ncbi:DUF393 domain-containing protein [Planctomicrobium sp.]|jgi:predicted DCC family thiol-disulfide oxidoreductase YuxK|nr:DUF393 domain-containing protein [Planctomicrobium sp.]MBT5019180.1 DUF393 domain-containing protein [Planctomicrobium sp.]MDB4439402.1 DUF393 domain-containing protein [Planctomicrobium sp.]MDB4743031.1 DUF393 domain-containing protein [Planctomicrobium sp.]
MTSTKHKEFEVFYDGACPLCKREINLLSRWDKQDKIQFTDIAADDFSAESIGITYDQLMAEIYGRLPDGTFVNGVEVFRRLYSAVGFSWIVAPTRLPGISHVMDFGYRIFAKNRLRLTGRCDDSGCKTNV